MRFLRKNIIIKTINEVYSFLPKDLRRKSYWVIFTLFVNAVFDLLGVAMLFPVFSILIDDAFLENEYVSRIYHLLNFSSHDKFFLFICSLVLIVMLIKSGIYIYSKLVQNRFAQQVFAQTSINNLDAVFNSGYSTIQANSSSEILRDVSHLPRTFSSYIIRPTFVVINEMIVLFIILSILIYLYSSLVVMVIIPLIVVIYFFYRSVRNSLHKLDSELHEIQPVNFKSVLDIVHGYSDIIINNKYKKFRSDFSGLVQRERDIKVKQSVYEDMPSRVVEIGIVISIVIIMSYCFFLIDNAEERLYLLGIFGLAAFRITPSLNKILTAVVKIKGKQYAIEVLNKWENVDKLEFGNDPVYFENNITLNGVSFSYDSSNVLDNISLRFEKGKISALYGPSGVGKSTIVKLIAGLELDYSGEILIGADKLGANNLKSWRRKLAFVGQKVHLLDDSLLNNVAFGEEQPDEELAEECIRMAELGKLIDDADSGIRVEIGEGGTLFSGGQAQRIGIARALYKKPEVLILDESTNSLDKETEQEILRLISRLKTDRNLTVIMITHNQENLKFADEIIDLK